MNAILLSTLSFFKFNTQCVHFLESSSNGWFRLVILMTDCVCPLTGNPCDFSCFKIFYRHQIGHLSDNIQNSIRINQLLVCAQRYQFCHAQLFAWMTEMLKAISQNIFIQNWVKLMHKSFVQLVKLQFAGDFSPCAFCWILMKVAAVVARILQKTQNCS